MRKVLWWRFHKYLEHYQVLTLKAFSEIAVFRECSNEDFNSLRLQKYISYGRHPFFSKCLKFDAESINGTKNWGKVCRFSYNYIWDENGKFSQSSIGYLPTAVNVLRNIPKISPDSTGDIFQINFSRNYENTCWKCSHGGFASIWETLSCWVSKRVPKRRFFQIVLTEFFTVFNFGNTLAMSIIFFFKMFEISCIFQKSNKKFRKRLSFFR